MIQTKISVINTQACKKHIRKLSICQTFSVCRLLSSLILSEAIPHLSFNSAHFSLSFLRRLPAQRQATLIIKTLEMANHYLRKQLSLSIHADERMCHVFEVHQGSPWGPCGQLVVKSAECTEEKLMAFVEGRAKTIRNAAPKVFNAKIYTTKSESGCLSARLTVAESDRALLQARNFWPRPIYARPWHFHLTSSKEGESKEISVVKVLKTSTCKDHDDKDGGAEPQPKCELDDALGQDHV